MIGLESNMLEGLEQIGEDVQAHVVRSVAHAGAVVLYDEAKLLAPVYSGPPKDGVTPGQLRDAIYRVYAKGLSAPDRAVYEISWNHFKAPHAHLVENGHWLVKKINGQKVRIRWVPAHSFIRRANDRAAAAVTAMQERATEKMQQVLRKSVVDDFGNEVPKGGANVDRG
ncbi:HK97 gp10 family phage protein [Cupriavidus metallidurans]|jgi:Bacteriophage HK97-gp10, putative tail-component|nr:HK97 gp10 family phage protein [Cupriavidus sp. SHE]KWR80347.1 hypothetical protein RN01_19135 [Cupriavidus sp. SHE]QWC87707.1 HK97 gp10 family phage protein [Cupriavidus metallidurans]